MNDIVKGEEAKVKSLTLLDSEKREVIMGALPYTVVPYMPITTEFIENVILNDQEYPLLESKLSQSVTEMKSRINNLATSNYEYEKLQLEIEELEMDIEDVENSDVTEKRKEVKIKQLELEIRQKQWGLANLKNSIDSTFKEFKSWYTAVTDAVDAIKEVDKSVKCIDDIQFDKIRMAEIKIKMQQWREFEKHGGELTTNQKKLLEIEDKI